MNNYRLRCHRNTRANVRYSKLSYFLYKNLNKNIQFNYTLSEMFLNMMNFFSNEIIRKNNIFLNNKNKYYNAVLTMAVSFRFILII